MNKLISYAMDFASFLMEKDISNTIRRVILFGSVARNEATKDSDVDIFIDVAKTNKQNEIKIKKVIGSFMNSSRYRNHWELKGITNEVKLHVGQLDDWKDLKNSIISNGILLYGKFEEMPDNAIHKTIFSWENVSPDSKRVLLSKRLFGYKKGKKFYEGFVQKYEGERIGKGIIAILSSNERDFTKLFKRMGIKVRIKKILEYK